MSDRTGIAPEINPVFVGESPALSGRLAVLRSGKHLLRITQNLREVEAVMLGIDRQDGAALADLNSLSRSRLQSLDLMIQELTGLSDILIGLASRLPDDPDPHIDVLVELPRLQSLTQALRDKQQPAVQPQIVLF
ncbi:MAG: hypothetical protein Q7J44_04615 [Pseudotabrizicola sp.]|uniref:hypothetical protein n=1 Tax=Pseudotabrizicola sp. TaxID=2939647 RepID=UPI00271D6438|nr:hypothetical protein [Pseudotabrizicola sp.]MDO9637804.1 hypothetical protein [Pseudotabrizicola sp.]